MNRVACIFILLLFGIGCSHAQSDEYKQVKSTIAEFGIGYPISLTNSKSHLDAFFNIGYQKSISEKYFMGLFLSPQFRMNDKRDFALGSKIRIGKLLSTNKNISLGLGHAFYSVRHKAFPGLAVDFNYDKTNHYGFHIKYEEFNSDSASQERNIIVGLHHMIGRKPPKKDKTAKKGRRSRRGSYTSIVPIVVGIAGIIGLMLHLVSRSK